MKDNSKDLVAEKILRQILHGIFQHSLYQPMSIGVVLSNLFQGQCEFFWNLKENVFVTKDFDGIKLTFNVNDKNIITDVTIDYGCDSKDLDEYILKECTIL